MNAAQKQKAHMQVDKDVEYSLETERQHWRSTTRRAQILRYEADAIQQSEDLRYKNAIQRLEIQRRLQHDSLTGTAAFAGQKSMDDFMEEIWGRMQRYIDLQLKKPAKETPPQLED